MNNKVRTWVSILAFNAFELYWGCSINNACKIKQCTRERVRAQKKCMRERESQSVAEEEEGWERKKITILKLENWKYAILGEIVSMYTWVCCAI